jgi:hypothetical protein
MDHLDHPPVVDTQFGTRIVEPKVDHLFSSRQNRLHRCERRVYNARHPHRLRFYLDRTPLHID